MSKSITILVTFLTMIALPTIAQDSVWCSGTWKQSVVGDQTGYNSMNSTDIDGDGLDEIVMHDNKVSSYWLVMKYSSTTGKYHQTWISQAYPQASISCLEIFDLDSDGEKEVVVALDYGRIEVWDGTTLTMDDSFVLQYPAGNSSEPEDMLVADADNDGATELVISTYSHLFVYNPVSLDYENVLPYGGYNIACGNTDSEPGNELVVSSGSIIRLNGNELNVIWEFANSYFGFEWTGLIDCDGDGMQEVFYEIGDELIAYDADLQQVNYQIPCMATSNSCIIKDTDNNGSPEILFADFEYGNIRCIDPFDGSELWSFYKESVIVNSIDVADVDHDGSKEVIWTVDGFVHVYGMESLQEEWVNQDIEGPFTARVSDVDGDGEIEILSFSQSSENSNSSGILTIMDESTRTIEWQSDKMTFDFLLTNVFDFEVRDIDNDGVTEIIVAAGAWIWVMNGQTHEIESSHEFNINFKSIEIDDIDNNGTLEYLCLTNSGLYAIDPVDYTNLWHAGSNTYGSNTIIIGNTDSDPAKEIVVYGWGTIGIIDGITQEVITTEDSYSVAALCDVDNDGVQEVLGGTLQGKIAVLDGQTLELTGWLPFNMGNSYISGLVATDFENDGTPDIAFTYGDVLYFSDLSGFMNTFAKIGLVTSGCNHPIKVTDDYDNDGKKEIFVSSDFQLVEYRYDCYRCRNFDGLITGEDISCVSDFDGSAQIVVSGGTPPYNYLWNNGITASGINDLTPGTYSVTTTDALGCTEDREIVLIKSFLEVSSTVLPRGCDENHLGEILLEITEGHPPYNFNWSGLNDSTSIVTGLEAGTYSVLIDDSKQCTADLNIVVPQHRVSLELEVTPVTCNLNGQIHSNVTGIPPYSYNWSDGSTDPTLFAPGEGTYTLTVKDSLACSDTATGIIYNADNLSATVLKTDDNPETPAGEGMITIRPSGGVPPYQFYNGNLITDSIINGLTAGTYNIRVTDNYNCMFYTTVTIEYTTGISESPNSDDFTLYPNPATNEFSIDFKATYPNKNVYAELYSSQNILLRSYRITGKRTTIPVNDLKKGIYFIKLYIDTEASIVKVIVI